MSSFTLALVQMRCASDRATNMRRAIGFIEDAAKRGANIVCLPELFLGPYFCQKEDASLFDLAESIPGPSSDELGRVAKQCGVVLVASLFERRSAGIFHNTAVVFDVDGTIVGRYRKMHIPDDPLYYEKYYFTPGDLGFQTFATKHARIGTLVCWDQWFPEGARLTAMRGADVLIYPTAIGWHPKEKDQHGVNQQQAWETIQRSHAIANGVFVAAINRVGHEGPKDGGLEFWGNSFVCDPFGVVLAKAGLDEELMVVTCDRARMEDVRRNWPFFRDRRIDAYGDLNRRLID